ncbi:MAG: transglycosylase SLT domain-containing protein [Bacteroidetes bacterium]|nr:transglycosylase SLT domain-containing protein [Bacteroidota bacterium]
MNNKNIKEFIKQHLKWWKIVLFTLFFSLITYTLYFVFKSDVSNENPNSNPYKKIKPVDFDLDQIKLRGKIIGIVLENSASYFKYQGVEMGFEYEVMSTFAKKIGVDFEIKVAKNKAEAFYFLNKGIGDIFMGNLVANSIDKDYIGFSDYYGFMDFVLLQRREIKKNANPDDTIKIAKYIKKPADLINQMVATLPNSKSEEVLKSFQILNRNRTFSMLLDADYNNDDLARMVSAETVDYAIVEENTAYLNNQFYGNLDYSLKVGFPQMLNMGIRSNAPMFQQELNTWIRQNRDTGKIKKLYRQWFKEKENAVRYGVNPEKPKGVGICKYDYLIQKYAKEINWDWRLVAAIIWQESRFNASATSFAGARGLMQVMPGTANDYGVSAYELYNPEVAIKTGVTHLKSLIRYWGGGEKIWHPGQEIKFILASYNAGTGHVEDARRLAKNFGAPDQVWDRSVEYYLYYLNTPQFYNNPVVQYGYCRGPEPYQYVKNIVAKFLHWGYTVDYYYQAQPDAKAAHAPWVRQFILDYEDELIKKNNLIGDIPAQE